MLRVQPGEGRTVSLVVGLMFVTVAGQTIGESGVSALFFDRVGTSALPLMYLLQGATGLAAMLVLTGSLGHGDRRRTYAGLLLMLAVAVLVLRALAIGGDRWVYGALWLTASLGTLLEAIAVWGTAGLVTDTRRAKRLFPLFGAGNILGAIVGGLLTSVLARAFGAQNLLFTLRRTDGTELVLRRPGRHIREDTAAAFARESRVLSALSGTSVPHPRLYASCPDDTVSCWARSTAATPQPASSQSNTVMVASSRTLRRRMFLPLKSPCTRVGGTP